MERGEPGEQDGDAGIKLILLQLKEDLYSDCLLDTVLRYCICISSALFLTR